MAKGSPTITVRLSRDMLAEIDDEVKRMNVDPEGAEFTRTDFVLLALHSQLTRSAADREQRKPKRRKQA